MIRRALPLIVLLIIVLGGLCFVGFKIYNDFTDQGQVSSNQSDGSGVAAEQIYRSPYFEFQDSGGNWLLDKSSTANKFVYYKFRSGQSEHELIINVNQVPNTLFASRGLPVTIATDQLDPGTVTDHCRKMYGVSEPMISRTVTMDSISFPCVPDTSQYSIYVSQIGGDQKLLLRRSGGDTATYVIFYRDLRFNNDSRTITNVIKTFRAI